MTSLAPVSAGVRVAGLSLLLLGQMAGGQTIAPTTVDPSAPVVAAPLPPKQWRLARDTAVQLMVLNEVSSRNSTPGQRFKLRVNQSVVVDGQILIPEGATAWGEVATADASGRVGQAGSLAARLLHIDLDGTLIRLRGQSSAEGDGGAERLLLSVIGFGVLGLLAKGNNAKLKAGDRIDGQVAEAMIFVAGQAPIVAPAETPVQTAPTAVAPAQAAPPPLR